MPLPLCDTQGIQSYAVIHFTSERLFQVLGIFPSSLKTQRFHTLMLPSSLGIVMLLRSRPHLDCAPSIRKEMTSFGLCGMVVEYTSEKDVLRGIMQTMGLCVSGLIGKHIISATSVSMSKATKFCTHAAEMQSLP